MSYIIQDRVEISIIIGDLNYPLGELNTLNYLHLGSSLRLLVPTLQFSVTDQSGLLTASILKDGIPIKVMIKAIGQNQTYNYDFIHAGFKYANSALGMQYTIYGHGGSHTYFVGTSTEGIRGTSSDVIQEIALKSGLRFEGHQTSDPHLWHPQNRTYAVFARRTSNAGFLNEQSLMKLGLCLDGTLRYRNISEQEPPVARLLQGKTDEGFIPVVNHEPKTNNGSNNPLSGYVYERRIQSSRPQALSNVTFTPDSNQPMIDTGVKDKVGRGLQTFSPIDVGNTTPLYDRALYQNRRLASLYSFGCDFQTMHVSGLKLLDHIDFTCEMENGTVNKSTTGTYRVTSHAILVQGPNYYEKIEGYRQGTNWD